MCSKRGIGNYLAGIVGQGQVEHVLPSLHPYLAGVEDGHGHRVANGDNDGAVQPLRRGLLFGAVQVVALAFSFVI